MEFQKQTILEKITEIGWKVTELEKYKLDWWANEMWLLESVWTPIGKTAFVTFLLEPENMRYIWSILATEEKPVNWCGNPKSFSLSLKGWEKELPEFIKFLSEIRNQQSQNAEE